MNTCEVRNVNVSLIMSLCGFSLNGIADIFPQTSQISSGEVVLSLFANYLYDELGIAEIRASVIN